MCKAWGGGFVKKDFSNQYIYIYQLLADSSKEIYDVEWNKLNESLIKRDGEKQKKQTDFFNDFLCLFIVIFLVCNTATLITSNAMGIIFFFYILFTYHCDCA